MLASQRDAARLAELERCRYEVALHEQHIRALTSLHQEGWAPWDWRAVASSPRPVDPAELQRWDWFQRVSRGVLSGEPEACQAVLDYLGPFQTFQQLGSSLNVLITRGWCVEAWLTANDERVVPAEKLSLTSTGKVSRRKMPVGEYWALYQDHVCSAALRVAREVFALLPVAITLVHVGHPYTNSRTGMLDRRSILSVAFEREVFVGLNLDAIDPSDSMTNFEHQMKYKKSSGFEPIELLTPEDLGVEES